MTTEQRITQLKNDLEEIYSTMPETFLQQSYRDKAAFEISKELEMLENTEGYNQNKAHWEGHELRF